MSKNMTRKGLAFGAASSLIVAGFAGLPAQAAGLADTSFVSLAPSTGDEYVVLTGTLKEFTLTANEASSVAGTGRNLSFLVEDGNNGVEPKASETTGYGFTVDDWTADADADTVTILEAGHTLKNGDLITVTGLQYATEVGSDGATSDTLNQSFATSAASYVVSNVVAGVSFDFAITHAVDVVAGIANTVNYSDNDEGTIELIRSKRSTVDGSYVVNTGSADANVDEDLTLVTSSSETATRTVKVTAWVDSNGNRLIDSTEYVSPTETVTFIKASELTVATTLNYPTAGDTNVSAKVALTPNLNEEQLSAGDVQIGFTRPGSTATVYANATQGDVTRAWSATQSLVTGNWAGMPHIWQLKSVDSATSNPDKYVTEVVANGLYEGDTVIVDSDLAAMDLPTATAVASVNADADATTGDFTTANSATTGTDSDDEGYVRVVTKLLTSSEATATYAEYITEGAHGLSVGDIVSVNSSITANSDQLDVTRAVVSSVPNSTTFRVAGTFVVDAADGAEAGTLTYVSYTEAIPGTYSAKTKVASVAYGNTSTNVTVANTSNDTTLATTPTVNVQGVSNSNAADTSTYTTAYVRKAEKSVELVASIIDEDEVAVSAGRAVVVSLENLQGNGAAAKSGTFKINGTAYTSAVTLLTDANGQVKFTVSDDDGAVTTKVRVLVAPENLTGAQTADVELVWADTVYSIYDLNDTAVAASTGNNSIVAGGNYSYSLAVLDQWKATPADGTHRVKYATTGRTVATGYTTLAAGKGTYTVGDSAISGQTAITTVFTLEKLATDGTWTANQELLNDGDTDATNENVTFTTSVVAATQVDAVLLDVDGSTAYGSGTADLSNTATTKQLAEQDRRLANLVQPAYGATNVVVTGRVANSLTNVPRAGADVTITGPTSILFSAGAVDKLGSVTLKADANGEFAVNLYSTTAQTDTVITVTSGGASKTVKVSFTGLGASYGTSIVIDAPAYVKPGTSFQVVATLKDKYGNPVVSTTGDRMKVTYDGPGIVILAMPTDTDTKGQVKFTVLLGTNDSGSGVISVGFDFGDDGDWTGTTAADADVVVTKTITVGTAPAAGVVNAGSFNGYVAVYAKGLNGSKLSWRIAGVWFKTTVDKDYVVYQRKTAAVGKDVTVLLYVDGALQLTKVVTTK